MFSSISWSQYAITLLGATAVYYLFTWILFFKAKVPSLHALTGSRNHSAHGEDSPDEVMTTVQHVIEELRPLFTRGAHKNELLFSIQQHLVKYSDWQEPGFRDAINQYISRSCGTTCSIRLGEDDLRALWK